MEGAPITRLSVDVLGACLQPLTLRERVRANRISKFFSAACHTAVAWQHREGNVVWVNSAFKLAQVVMSTLPFPHISLYEYRLRTQVKVSDLMFLRTVRLEPRRDRLVSLWLSRVDMSKLGPELLNHKALRHLRAEVDTTGLAFMCQGLPQLESVSASVLVDVEAQELVLSPRLRSLQLDMDMLPTNWLSRFVHASWSQLRELQLGFMEEDDEFDLRRLSVCESLTVLRLHTLEYNVINFWPWLPRLHELTICMDVPETNYEGMIKAFPNLRVIFCEIGDTSGHTWTSRVWRVLAQLPIVELKVPYVLNTLSHERWEPLPHVQVLHVGELDETDWDWFRRTCPRLHTVCLPKSSWSDETLRAEFASLVRQAGLGVRYVK